MQRLDPAHPPVWRNASTLQFGLDAVLVLSDVQPWQERFIRELEVGLPPAAVAPLGESLGVDRAAAEAFVRRLGRVMAANAPVKDPPVTLQLPDGVSQGFIDEIVGAFSVSGMSARVEHWSPWLRVDPDDRTPVVLIAAHVVEPRRAAALLGRDVRHLPVVFGGRSVEVGPFVRPGRTPCLACLAAQRIDADPEWPALAAQLVGRRLPPAPSALVWEAGLAAARMVSDAECRPARQAMPSVTILAATGARTTRLHRPHAACRCRSLAGTATAPDLVRPETTTGRVFARPA
jgi:hypothetical protein